MLSPCPHCRARPVVVARLLSRAVTCPGLVFTLHRRGHRWWCCCRRLRRGYRCAPGCRLYCGPARRNIISALKMERKNNSRVGPEGVTSQPHYWSPLWSPVPTVVAPPGCCSRCRCRLGPVSVVAVISVVAAPRESLMLSWFSFTLRTSSLFVNNR